MTQDFTITLEEAQKRFEALKTIQNKIKEELTDIPLKESKLLEISAHTFQLNDLYDLFERIYKFNNPQEPTLNLDKTTIANPINAIRFYPGQKFNTSTEKFQICLMAVAVTGFNGISNLGGQDVKNLPDITGTVSISSIYDFSFPCPSTCPLESIMH
jgi:hypothetical protein